MKPNQTMRTLFCAASAAMALVAALGPLAVHADPAQADLVSLMDCPVPGQIEGRPGYGLYIDRNTGHMVGITNQGGFVGGSSSSGARIFMTRNAQGSCLIEIKETDANGQVKTEAPVSYYHVRAHQIHIGGQWRACQIHEFYDDYFQQMCNRPNLATATQPRQPTQPQTQVQGDQPATVLCGNELDRYELMSAYKDGVSRYSLQGAYDKVMSRVCPGHYVSSPGSADNRNDCLTESGRYARVSQYRGSIPSCGRECAHDYVLAQVCPNYNQLKQNQTIRWNQPAQQPTQRSWWQGDTSEFANSHLGVR